MSAEGFLFELGDGFLGKLFDLLRMQVGRGTDNNGVDVISGSNSVQIADFSAILLRHRSSIGLNWIEHGGQFSIFVAVNCTRMNLANATSVFSSLGWIAVGCGVLVLLISPLLKYMMHEGVTVEEEA